MSSDPAKSGTSSRAAPGARPAVSAPAALRALCQGDFGARATLSAESPAGLGEEDRQTLADAVNGLTARVAHLGTELVRVLREVTRHGRIDERLSASPGTGAWTDTVLAADTLLDALTHALGRVGRSVRYAENGREGMTGLGEGTETDLVLRDIMMPELDGYEAIRTPRADPRLASLPAIALTARAMPGDDQRCLASGASPYVPGPVDIDLLLSTVLALLDPQSSTRPQ